MRTVAPPRGNL